MKTLKSVLLCGLLAIVAIPTANAQREITVSNFSEFQAAINSYKNTTECVIINVATSITIANEQIDIIGSRLTPEWTLTIRSPNSGTPATLNFEQSLFSIAGRNLSPYESYFATLILENISIEGTSVDLSQAVLTVNGYNGTLILGNGAEMIGTSVHLHGGEFGVSGGTISDNVQQKAVSVFSGHFLMSGGAITQNSLYAVYFGSDDATFTLIGGVISDNEATAVSIANDRTFVIFGGMPIVNNNEESNVSFGNNVYAVLSTSNPPTAGMNIGITKTANDGIFVQSGATQAHVPFFFADEAGKQVVHPTPGVLQIIQREPVSINVSANPIAGGTVSGGGTNIAHSTSVTVQASANAGWNFVNWTEDGVVVSQTFQYTFTATNSRNLIANFTSQFFDVTVSANPPTAGFATGGGTNIEHSTSVTVTATANECWQFVSWTINDVVVSTQNPFTFSATETAHLVANFDGPILDFDTYASTLWNNTFMLNLNRLRADGFEALDARWFRNGIEITNTRTGSPFSYSAGPNASDLLQLAPTFYHFEILTERCGVVASTLKTITSHNPVVGAQNFVPLHVFPNPIQSGGTITLENTTAGHQIQIFNRSGMLVKSAVATDGTTLLTLNIPQGIYVIHVDNNTVQILVTE